MIKLIDKRGIALIEVILASVLISIIVSAATSIIYSSTRVSSYTKQDLAATNLAREGIESIANIIDTNKIRCGNDNKNSWRLRSSETSCDGGYLDDKKYYRIALDPTQPNGHFKWKLDSYDSYEHVINEDDPSDQVYQLNLKEILATPFYTYDATAPKSFFYRQIQIEFVDGDEDLSTGDENGRDSYIVTSIVAWLDNGKKRQVKLSSLIN